MANIDRLRGCGTAIVTPFKQDESIDESAFRRLVEFQIENGVDFIVACGTTGESVTMSDDEQARVVELTVEASEGRAPATTGARPSEASTVSSTTRACSSSLIVTLSPVVPQATMKSTPFSI